jgi:S-adenosylhomocysteine hydrolase
MIVKIINVTATADIIITATGNRYCFGEKISAHEDVLLSAIHWPLTMKLTWLG